MMLGTVSLFLHAKSPLLKAGPLVYSSPNMRDDNGPVLYALHESRARRRGLKIHFR